MGRGKGTVNKVILIGRLGGDPQLRYTTSGQANCSFSLATNAMWKDQSGETQERTDWHNIKAWGKLAEIMGEYLQKGSLVCVEGRLQTRSYNDSEGEKKWITEVIAGDMEMLGNREENKQHKKTQHQDWNDDYEKPPAKTPTANQQSMGFDGAQEDDLPF